MSDEMPNDTLPTGSSGESNADRPADAAPYEDRYRRRAERRAARREGRRSSTPWLAGAILIVLGLVFLAQNAGIATLNNWWAVFILIPAVASFTAAWRRYQAAGQVITSGAVGSLVGGLIFTAVALGFLFDLGPAAGFFWPVLLIIGGVALLLQAVIK